MTYNHCPTAMSTIIQLFILQMRGNFGILTTLWTTVLRRNFLQICYFFSFFKYFSKKSHVILPFFCKYIKYKYIIFFCGFQDINMFFTLNCCYDYFNSATLCTVVSQQKVCEYILMFENTPISFVPFARYPPSKTLASLSIVIYAS